MSCAWPPNGSVPVSVRTVFPLQYHLVFLASFQQKKNVYERYIVFFDLTLFLRRTTSIVNSVALTWKQTSDDRESGGVKIQLKSGFWVWDCHTPTVTIYVLFYSYCGFCHMSVLIFNKLPQICLYCLKDQAQTAAMYFLGWSKKKKDIR